MTEIRLQASGLEELTDMLKNVAPRSANNIMRNAVTDLARDVRDEMKAKAPKDTGTLQKAIKAKRNRGKKDVLEASVIITHGKGAKYDAFYWHFIEFGTAAYQVGDVRASGQGRAKMNLAAQPARPFITPATESIRPQVPRLMREHFGERYEKEMTRLARKARGN